MVLPAAGYRAPALGITQGGKQTQRVRYEPRGAAKAMLECREFEVLSDGPVGTGKSFGVLWKVHLAALKYPGMKALLLRKTQTSLTGSAIQTYTQKVLTSGRYGVKPFSGNVEEPAGFRYPNGSKLVVGGMDKASKVMSTEYDMAAAFEATELSLDDWESVTTRLRNGVMPYQQIIADCNPGTPSHWLNQRANEKITTRLLSRHKDNPKWWDIRTDDWTPEGYDYVIKRLGRLTGVRRKRLLDGIWAAAEGQVYEGWDPAVHLIDRYEIPYQWPRFWVIDFGFVHPFVWQAWAMKPDGELVMYREIYMTRRLVSQHAQDIMALTANEPRPSEIITDHDAEDRATFQAETGYSTTPAIKNVSAGIQAVANRLRGEPGRPRLFIMRDSLGERDESLSDAGHPACTEEEFSSYVWNLKVGRRSGDEPVKEFDHGMDATRYLVAAFDLNGNYDDESDDVIAQMNRELA